MEIPAIRYYIDYSNLNILHSFTYYVYFINSLNFPCMDKTDNNSNTYEALPWT